MSTFITKKVKLTEFFPLSQYYSWDVYSEHWTNIVDDICCSHVIYCQGMVLTTKYGGIHPALNWPEQSEQKQTVDRHLYKYKRSSKWYIQRKIKSYCYRVIYNWFIEFWVFFSYDSVPEVQASWKICGVQILWIARK